MATKARIILLAGAPATDDLDWNGDRLRRAFDDVFARMLDGRRKAVYNAQDGSMLVATVPRAKWRAFDVDVESHDLETDSQQAFPQTQFLSFHGNDTDEERQHSEFLEHSVAAFDNLVSSQVLKRDPAAAGQLEDTLMTDSTSFATTDITEDSSTSSKSSQRAAEPANNVQSTAIQGGVTNLKQIPSAEYISRILPQTMTINLIAGVVTVSRAKTVHLRKSNIAMDIIEVIVGDETRAGFPITFWLAPLESQHKAADDLREKLRDLRPGDVLLLQNIALSSFRNCVYGQSLSKRFARNSTLVTLMGDETTSPLPGNASAKLQRVQGWISDFVGLDTKPGDAMLSTQGGTGMRCELPPDTQD